MKAIKELFAAAVCTVLLAGCATSRQTSNPQAAAFDVIDREEWSAYVQKRQALMP